MVGLLIMILMYVLDYTYFKKKKGLIKHSDLFEADSDDQLKEAIEKIKDLDEAYQKVIKA